MRRNGFTLVELLVVVAIMATIAGAAMFMADGAESSARTHMQSTELAEIRSAVVRFRADMGGTPRYLAELLQSPDPADHLGGWWWRVSADAPPAVMRVHDPVTRRGWNGPYLRAGFRSGDGGAEASETRVVPGGADGTVEQIDSNETSIPPRRLAMLLSEGQRTAAPRVAGDYRLDLHDPAEATIRFLAASCHPRREPSALGLGVRP